MGKYFHNIGSMKKALAYGSTQGMGPFRQRPRKKKTAPSAANTESGEAETIISDSASHDTKETEEKQA